MSRLRRAALATVLACQAGCVFAYSFDALRGGEASAADASADDGAVDAGPTPARYCASVADKVDFCDDFDDDAPIGAHWNVESAFANPVLFLDASVSRIPVEGAPLVSAPSAIRMTARGARAKATLFGALRDKSDAAPAHGVEIALSARPVHIEMPQTPPDGPLTGVLIASVLTQVGSSLGGVSIFYRDEQLFLAQTVDLGPDAAPPDRATFVPFSIVGVSGVAVWGRLRMAIGPRDMVVARGFTCDEVKDGAAFVTAADSTLQTACMPLGGRFASADWLARGFLEVGPLIVGTADVEMLADNVTATVF